MSVENEPDPQAAGPPNAGARAKAALGALPKMNAAQARQKAEFILSRAWGLARNPRAEWEQIKAEETSVARLLLGYVAPLAAIPPIAGALGSLAFGEHFGDAVVRTPPGTVLISAVVTFLASVALVYFLGILINVVAENFEADRNEIAAQKVAAYAMTPAFLSGIFSLWPPIWWVSLIGIAMTAFLFYRGLPPLMKAEPDRALGYAATVMIAGLVAFIVLFALAGCVTQANHI